MPAAADQHGRRPARPGGDGAATRTLWVVRHAHAAAHAPEGDIGRPVDERGRAQLAALGRTLAGMVADGRLAAPALVATSTARRARETAEALALAVGAPAPVLETGFYRADADDLVAWLRGVDDGTDPVALVGHNPTMADLVDLLAGSDAAAPGFPTASVAVLALEAGRWSAVDAGGARLLHRLRG